MKNGSNTRATLRDDFSAGYRDHPADERAMSPAMRELLLSFASRPAPEAERQDDARGALVRQVALHLGSARATATAPARARLAGASGAFDSARRRQMRP